MGSHLSAAGRGRTPGEDLAFQLDQQGYRVTTTSSKRSSIPRALDMLSTSLVRRNDYQVSIVDVFSGRSFRYAEAVTTLHQRLERPIILYLHGGALPDFAQANPQRVERLFGRASAIVSPSPYLARSLGDFGSIKVIPNPIDFARFSPAALRQPGSSVRVLWLRAFHQIYRPHDAIEVVARARAQRPNIRLWMIGPDKGDGSLADVHRAIERFNAHDFVEIESRAVPHLQIPTKFANADLFLNTTSVDNTPVSVLEAMAAGLPVVSTDAGGIPDLLEHGDSAMLAAVGDTEAMATAVLSLLEDVGLYQRLQVRAQAIARRSDWVSVLPQWTRLLETVVFGGALSK